MRSCLIATLILSVFLPPSIAQQQSPDMILLNGRIFTSDSAQPYVEALAIRGERVVATGNTKEVSALAGPQTKRIDLDGRVVIPGINDAHYHCDAEPNASICNSMAWIRSGAKWLTS